MFLHSRVIFMNYVSDVELDPGGENPQERDRFLLLRHSRHGWEAFSIHVPFQKNNPCSRATALFPIIAVRALTFGLRKRSQMMGPEVT